MLELSLKRCRLSSFQMLIKAGVDGKPTVFLFSDNQIKEESFVEDINMILNTGDVPNIFPADEKADVIDKMQNVARTEVGYEMKDEDYQLQNLLKNFSLVENTSYFVNTLNVSGKMGIQMEMCGHL